MEKKYTELGKNELENDENTEVAEVEKKDNIFVKSGKFVKAHWKGIVIGASSAIAGFALKAFLDRDDDEDDYIDVDYDEVTDDNVENDE